jgi:putative membrane protein
MRFVIEIFIMGLALLLGAYLVPGVHINGFGTAILAALLIALANATIGFILRLLTFPSNLLTLGLMSFIITVLMVLLVDNLLTGFSTTGFFAAAILAIVVALIKAILGAVIRD